jgi:hypothetical protein
VLAGWGLTVWLLAACHHGGGGGEKATTAQPAAKPEAGCKVHADGPSREQCQTVVAHLGQVMPHDMNKEDPEQDVCDCLGMPRQLIDCFGTAASSGDINTCIDTFAPEASGGAKQEHASQADCEAAIANLKTLAPDEMAGHEAEMIKQCVEAATPAQAACVKNAKSRDEVEACEAR